MSKFLLHGGKTSIRSENNVNFFKELTETITNESYLLIIYHALEKHMWEKSFLKDIQTINELTNRKISLQFGNSELKTLTSQITRASAILIKGGDTMLLKEKISPIKHLLPELFKNKVIGGSSAGAYLLSKYYYSNDLYKIQEGFSLLHIKIICHYNESLQPALSLLQSYKEKLKTFALNEGSYISLAK